MAIQFASVRPGIELFNANVARNDQANRQENADFMGRMQYEQAQGVDAARRRAAGVYFNPPTTTQAAPAPQPAPTAAGPAVPAISSFSADPRVAPQTPLDKELPDSSVIVKSYPPDGGAPDITTGSPQMPVAAPAPGSPAAGVTAPAISSVAAQPAARNPAVNRFSEMATELAKTPGTGADAMGMVTADITAKRTASTERRKFDIEQRKLEHDALTLFVNAGKNRDILLMRTINKQYKLGIPEAALNDQEFAIKLMTSMDNAEAIGKAKNPEQVLAYSKGYMHAVASNATPQQAHQAGLAEAQSVKPEFEAVHFDRSPTGEVFGVDRKMNVKKSGQIARLPPNPVGRGGAAGGTAITKTIDYMVESGIAKNAAEAWRMYKMAADNPDKRAQFRANAILKAQAHWRNSGRSQADIVREVDAILPKPGEFEGAPATGTEGPASAGPAGQIIDYDASGRRIKSTSQKEY
ncbi:MAG: hypothetical protein Q8P46_10520 [Hyphomicrobiales bacterium]|nr:hypothetical protein [Hyphomicrobiales bacterium]